MAALLYHESQPMIGAMFIFVIIIPLIAFIIYRFRHISRVNRILTIAAALVGSCVVIILAMLRLDTLYYTDRVEYQFISLFSAKYEVVQLKNVRSARVIIYNPETYGGWGVKGNEQTRVYNASGDKGLLLIFHSGKNLLLGTQQPDSLYAHLKDVYPFPSAKQ